MNLKIKLSSDLIGASASTLCTIHCLATPFIFFASTCTKAVVQLPQLGGYQSTTSSYLFHF